MEEQLIDTWQIHNRIHLYLLDAITPEALATSLNPKSRSVYAIFAHMHNVRLMWLKSAAPELLEGINKLDTKVVVDNNELKAALEASSNAIEQTLRMGLESGGKIKGFKPHAVAFLGYMISHESHHRGQAEWALRFSGHPLDQKTEYGIWEWGTR